MYILYRGLSVLRDFARMFPNIQNDKERAALMLVDSITINCAHRLCGFVCRPDCFAGAETMSESSSDTESSCGWTVISNEVRPHNSGIKNDVD